jgi:hypothetical protein
LGRKTALLLSTLTIYAAASSADEPAEGGSQVLELGADSGKTYRLCDWGDTRYGGYRTYYFDQASGNFRVWYVLDGPNALKDKRDDNKNGFPDVVERIGVDFELAARKAKADRWYYHPDPTEARYLPIRDYYAELNWPGEDEDYGDSDRWDIYCGQLREGIIGILYAFGPFPGSSRRCYSAYFNVRNVYDEAVSRQVAGSLWGTAVPYMFDAAETSGTPVFKWLTEATKWWFMERVYPPAVPGKTYFERLFNNSCEPLTRHGTTFVYFLEDWGRRYWVPPAWVPRSGKNDPIIRDVWRATTKGDAWYTRAPDLERTSEEAVSFVIERHNLTNAYVEGRAFKDAFELMTVWNWFTGARDDGRHYEYGAKYPTLLPHKTWTEYPVLNYEPKAPKLMNYLGAGYYRFDSLPPWPAAVITFEAYARNKAESKDWGGHVLVTKDGAKWTDLDGKDGSASPVFTPTDKGIIQIRNPSRFESVVAVVDCAAYNGTNLKFKYSFIPTDDHRAPAVKVAVARPQAYPAALEILLGGDEKLFGAEADVLFVKNGERTASRKRVEFADAGPRHNFIGTYNVNDNAAGEGVVTWRSADLAGNVVSGRKEFSAGFLAAGGGTVGGERALLKLPAGAVAGPTLFTIVRGAEGKGPAAAAAVAGEGPAVETLGPAYEYGPGWAKLAKAAEITLSYEGLEVTREDYLSVYRWNGAGWEDLGGTIDKRGRRVMAVADALGVFTLGYGEKKNTTPPTAKPMAFGLYQNYPNPARDETVIKYTLPGACEVELVVYDLSGRRVSTVVREAREAGVHEESYALADDSGRPLPAGVYFYRLSAGTDAATRKMVVAR